MIRLFAHSLAAGLFAVACSGGDPTITLEPPDAAPPVDFGEPTVRPSADGGASSSGTADAVAPVDANPGDVAPFATKVVSLTRGRCAGFGFSQMPDIVLGPPKGAGTSMGSLDVVSLGRGGEIVLSFEPNAIVDGEGTDFVVYENAFFAAGTTELFVEPGEVSVSEDGETWATFPCTATEAPWGACAGSHAVLEDGTGGDPYDLADLGVRRARFVRIVDKTTTGTCTSQGPNNYGFDLDAIRAVHFERR